MSNFHHQQQRQNKKRRLLHAGLILASLLGYLEWGEQRSAFFFQMEFDVFKNILLKPMDLLHPAIGMPLTGQLILLITVFQKVPSSILSWIGFGLLSPIFLFLLFIGIFSLKVEILLSAIPYWVIGSMFIKSWAFKHRPHHHQGPKSELL
jgi:hypothetical protein